MEKEDKVAFSILLIIVGAAFIGLLWLVKVIGSTIFGWFASDTGISIQSAFIYAVVVSFMIILLLALVSGDGVLGELPTVIVGFFVFVLFFTVSFVWIF